MKKSHKLYAIPLLALALAACTNDGLQDNPLADGPVLLNVTADISAVATRAQATAFEEGDPIGIFPMKNGSLETSQINKLYTYDGSKFTTDDPYYFQNTGNVTFNAYYPYETDVAADDPVIYINTRVVYQMQDVTLEETSVTWRKNDYLFASAATNVNTPNVSYIGDNAFKHVMSQVIFVFKAGTDSGVTDLSSLTQYKIATSLYVDGMFNLTTGIAAPMIPSNKDVITMDITATGTEYTCRPLILLPQTIDGTIDLEVSYNNQTYRASLTPPTGGLKAGYSYTYTVTIKNTELVVSDAEIDDWKIDPVFHGGSGTATLQ